MTEALQQEIRTLRSLLDSPRDPGGRVFAPLADAYRRAGRIPEALRLLNEGLAKHPDFATAHVVAARLYGEQGLGAEGALAARRALELDGENVQALRSLLRVLEESGETEAEDVRGRLLSLEPDFTPDWVVAAAPEASALGKASRAPDAPTVPVRALRGPAPPPPVEIEEVEIQLDEPLVPADAIDLGSLAPLPAAELPLSALGPEPAAVVPAVDLGLPDLVPSDVPLDALFEPEGPAAFAVEESATVVPEPVADEPVLDLAALVPEPVLDLATLAPEPVVEEPVMDLAALAPEPVDEEAVMDLAALAPDEEIVSFDSLAPDAAVGEEPVMDLAALAPDEEIVSLDSLAPDAAVAEEPVMDLAALAPDEEIVSLDALAPDATAAEAVVMELAALAPAAKATAATPLPAETSPRGLDYYDEPVIDLDSLAPARSGLEASAPTNAAPPPAEEAVNIQSLSPDEPDEIVVDLDALGPESAPVSAGAAPPGEVVAAPSPAPTQAQASATPAPPVPGPRDEEDEAEAEAATPSEEQGQPLYTRTLAELYAAQGATKQAVEVLRYLQTQSPADAELGSRIAELEAGGPTVSPPGAAAAAKREEELEALARDLAQSGEGRHDVETPFAWTEKEPEPSKTPGPTIREYFDDLLNWEPGGDA